MFCFNIKYYFVNHRNCFPPNLTHALFQRPAKGKPCTCQCLVKSHSSFLRSLPGMGELPRVSKFLRQSENAPSPFCNCEYGYLFLSLDLLTDWDILAAAVTLWEAGVFVGNQGAEPWSELRASAQPAVCEQTRAQTQHFRAPLHIWQPNQI